MRGDLLIVRCFGGVPKVVRFWSESPNAIFITSDEGFERLQKNDPTIFPIGFPREDVFKYDPQIAADIGSGHEWNWNKLIHISAQNIQ